jgi:hypothetical protein
MTIANERAATSAVPAILADASLPVVSAARMLKPWRQASFNIECARPHVLACQRDNVSRAVELRDKLPGRFEAHCALEALHEALAQRLDHRTALAMITVMPGMMGKKPSDEPELYLRGLTEAIGIDDDGIVDSDKAKYSRPVSPCVLAVAIRRVIRDQVFLPAPAEFRQVCRETQYHIDHIRAELGMAIETAISVEDVLEKFAPEHLPELPDDGWWEDGLDGQE